MNNPTQIINFLKYLSLHGVSPKSLKYYKSDLVNFLNWAKDRKVSSVLIQEYITSARLTTPTSTLNRRISTLRSYASFMGFKKTANSWQTAILSKFENKQKFHGFLNKLFFSRPNWYRKYHSYQLATYIHIAILVLFTSLAGYALYDQVFKNPANPLAFPTALTRPNRYLSFQGRLTDNLGNPKTVATNLVFKLYDASTAGTELWTSGTCAITPDQDGIFSTLLGSSCGAEIAATVFSENASVWVGVTVAADAEATPRVQIATVAYALNSETLQGFPAGTGTSTIPYINSTGALVLANASPTIQSTSGTFAVEGLAMTITTPNASDGIITINPDGVGTLNLTFEGAAAGASANGFVNATNANITSGALYGGTVASAATGYNFLDFQSGVSPASKFSVSATGAITTASGLTIGTTSLSETTSPTDSGGYLIGVNDEFANSASTNVQAVLNDLDAAITTGATPKWNALTDPDGNLSLAHAGYTTAFTFNSVTTADAFALSSSSLTTGTVLDLSSTSTAGGAGGLSKVLDIARSGTNANASHTAYGLYAGVTNTGTTSTNVGGYFSASGATNNYGLIVANGNVGIGTTSPGYKLEVAGTDAGSSSVAQTRYSADIYGPYQYYNKGRASGASANANDFAGGFIWQTVNSASVLKPVAAIWGIIESPTSGAESGAISFLTTTNGDIPNLTKEKMRITSAGNVGIGTTGPSGNLHISHDSANTIIFDEYGNTTSAANIQIRKGRGTAASPATVATGDYLALYEGYGYTNAFQSGAAMYFRAEDVTSTNLDGAISFHTAINNTLGERVRITSTGNVGIGTTAPLSNLHIGAQNAVLTLGTGTSIAYAAGDILGKINFYNADPSGGGPNVVASIRSEAVTGSGGDGNLIFGTNNQTDEGASPLDRMVIQNNGNVGIGTTGPGAKLAIQGGNLIVDNNVSGDSNSGIRIVAPIATSHYNWMVAAQQNVSAGFEITPSTAVGGTTFSTPAWSVTRTGNTVQPGTLTVQGTGNSSIAGNVGIGTTSPSVKLSVNGSVQVTGFSNPTSGAGFEQGYDGTQGILQAYNRDTPGWLPFWLNGSKLILQNSSGGNVGIGTTSPAATSILDLTSTTKGFLAPRMTGTQRDAITTPATGLMIYNTDTNQYNVFNGTTWGAVGGGGGAWSDLTVPTANLSLAHAGYTTAFTFNSVTTADAFALSSSSLTTGTILDLSSTSTAGGASGLSKVLDIGRSGTNANASHTAYGLYSAVTNTGTTSTNVGGYFSASGATNNYGLIVANGNVGIGTTGPTSAFQVGATDFAVDSVNHVIALAGQTPHSSYQLRMQGKLRFEGNGVIDMSGGGSWGGSGTLTLNPSSGNVILNPTAGNVGIGTTAPTTALQIGTAAETHTLDTGDVLISSDLEVDGVVYLDGGLIANSAGTTSIALSATPTTVANTLSASNWLIENTANVGQAALIINQQKAGDLFTASASGTPKFTIANTGAITSAIGSWTSQVADSATAVGFTLNTTNTLSTQGSKLLSLQNNGTEKMYLDKDGNLYVSGTVLSGNGTSMLLTNKSGGIVASKAIVVLDTSNNTSFTTTTTPYSKSGFGVVVGVGLGVTNDADGDGVCDADDICMVAYAGSVNVTVKNATTAVKGDYLFTSDTAGSAVASAKQYDGLVGIVDDTTNSASGYLKMIFKVQPQVTAAAAIDKTTKHNEYWLYADQYQAVGEGANTDTNLLQRGLAFDTFTDSTKTDSANTTVSYTPEGRVGLIGGQTLATSTTDNDGQTYLGSNTVNDTFYYDRVRDSSPQVQVELGIDPNWYNGVTLSVATTSAQFSQNSVITQPNPNLSTTYNGSLIKVTGTDSTPRTIYITIKSPTTFDWTNYNGQAATGVTITPGTAQALGTTGVSATFTNARYNTGDVFKIASWFIEAESATRGAKQQFPEKSTIIATASSVDIIDADTQKLWMRFSQGTSYAIGVDANNDPSSANMLNGKAYISTNGSAATGLYTLDFAHDAVFKQNATDYRLSDTALYGRNGTNTYNVINTSNILVNITANDVSAAVIPNQPTQEVTVSGWGYIQGNGTSQLTETVNLPYKFNTNPNVTIVLAGDATSVPTSLSSCAALDYYYNSADLKTVSTTKFTASIVNKATGPIPNTHYDCYTWTATGQVSPRQYVGAATNGGTTVINETDQSAVNLYYDGSWNKVTQVALTNKDLYYTINNATNYQLATKYGIGGYTTNQTGSSYSDKEFHYSTIPASNTSYTVAPTSLSVTRGTSTIDGKSNTIFVGYSNLLTVIQEKQNGGTDNDSDGETGSSVKYYTKDYISEEMIGDIRGMFPMNYSGLVQNTTITSADVSVKADAVTTAATATIPTTGVSGVRGTAISFDGGDILCTGTTGGCADNDNLDFAAADNFSVGAWIKHPASAATRTILTKGSAVDNIGYRLYMKSTDVLCFGIDDDAVSFPDDEACTTAAFDDNLWHHVVGVKSGTSNIRIYVDGVEQGSDISLAATGTLANANGFRIGAASDALANPFAGTMDELFVTATALTAGQIKNMYQVGYRALQSHATTLGGGAADTNQQLGGTTNVIGAAQPDYNNQFMYVGTNSTTLGAVSKIDLNSDTNIKTYNSSANVPTGGPLLIDEDTKSLAVGYNLEAVGSATTGVKTMGVDNNATATSGNFIGKTVTTAESFTQAYLWAQYTLDASDASNTIQVWASNDGGSNYSQCNLTNTDTSRSPSEYEYFCQFNTAGSSLKTKFAFARGSTKTNTYVARYGISWIDSNAVAGSANGSGLFTGSNASVANGSYIDVAHNQNSNDLVTNGWVYNTVTSKWEVIDVTSNEQATSSAQVNYNTEANYTQENMAYAVTLTPSATSGDITLTLGSGTWNSDARIQAGTRVVGNGGIATITGTPAAQTTIAATVTTAFTNTNAIASGSWYLYATTFDGSVAKLNTYNDSPDSYTKSLLHTDGTDASTTFTDEIGKTWTPGGNAQIDTAQSKFGGASGLFDGTGDYVSTPDHADFTLGTNDFTIDLWARFSAFNTVNTFYGQGDTTPTNASIPIVSVVHNSNKLMQTCVYYNGATSSCVYSTATFAIDTWYHVAIVRNGNTLTQYVDGVANGTINMTGITPNDSNQVMAIGRLGAHNGNYMKGWIEEFRFSNGIARWATGFTPPTSQYNPSASSPTSQNYSVVTNSDQLATASWDHVENAVVTETLNSQTINYSVSFDGKTTFYMYDSTTSNNGWRPIARNNSGTWQYNSNTTAGVSNVTWTSATYNSQNGAISQAAGVTQNQMSGTTLNAVTALQWREINGFTPTTNTIDFAAALKTTSAAQIPQVDQIKVNYTQAGMKIVQTDANTVRLYNYSGATQNLRLDVITGGLGRNAGTVSLAPAAADVDSQTSTNSLWINKTGTGGNLLKLQTSGADMTLINNFGDITGGITTLDGSTTANGAGTASTTLILTSATNFNVGNYVKVSSTDCVSGVNVCYAKITNIATNTLTISPALTWANGSAVVEVHVPELGGIDTSQALANRYGRGYFIDGIVTGNGSTYFTDNLINFGGGSKIQDAAGKLQLQAGGTGTGSTGTASIYFLDSSGTTAGRFDTTSSGLATGGTITTDGNYTVHTFTSSGTFTPPSGGNVEYLVVGGGGGGGSAWYSGGRGAGGGGAGGFLTNTGFAVTAQGYTVTVGGGGAGGASSGSPDGQSGSNSVFSTITATGGGGGGGGNDGGSSNVGLAGGSGGGGAHGSVGGSGTGGQGYTGGTGCNGCGGSSYVGGGGGGASQVGYNGTASAGGNGGDGISSSITGSAITYAGGGAGATGGTGGAGGGGNVGSAGTTNRGGGGGGNRLAAGGAGGSGIIIIRYLTDGTFSGYGTLYLGATNTSSSDLAEYYVAGDKTISAGDVVSISNTKVLDDGGEEVTNQGVMRKANKPYDSKLIGIISTNPGVLMGSIDGDTGQADKRMLALSGRVPVKIDPDSEPIEVGDFLTSSDKPGLAKKATQAGYTVGKALQAWTPSEISNCSNCSNNTIEVFVNLGYHDPDLALTDSGDILLASNSANIYNVSTTNGIATKIGAFAEASIAKLKAGIGSFRQVETSLISPIANTDLIIDLQPDNSEVATQLIIKGENDEVVTSFDAYGNATISGTLYANNIESQRLEDIEELLREVETNQLLLTEAANWNINTATASADLTATNLFVTGQAAISSLFVSDNFTTKNINSLTEPLSIQSLASAPLEIMAGKIIIDTDGNTKFLGNVEIAGDLKINNIIVANNIEEVATESASIIEGEINSNATAGKAVLTANTEKIRINNNKVSLNTLIYITPITSTQNKVLYVKAKDTGFFDIGFSDTLDTDVEFNWWIIELESIESEPVLTN